MTDLNYQENYIPLLENSRVSYQILRTNPMLTGNVKLLTDGDDMWLESFSAVPTLMSVKYKKFYISGQNHYNTDITKFFEGLPIDTIYKVHTSLKDTAGTNKYSQQYETMYWSGCEEMSYKQYGKVLGIKAPIYFKKIRPRYFVVFKLPGAASQNSTFDFNNDILKNSQIIKTFDLTTNTKLGRYIDNYLSQSTYKENPLYVNFQEGTIRYTGIDITKSGEIISVEENINKLLLKNDNPTTYHDYLITEGFRRNKLILPQIINLEFLFNDDGAKEFEFSRYFGMYCNDIDTKIITPTSINDGTAKIDTGKSFEYLNETKIVTGDNLNITLI